MIIALTAGQYIYACLVLATLAVYAGALTVRAMRRWLLSPRRNLAAINRGMQRQYTRAARQHEREDAAMARRWVA